MNLDHKLKKKVKQCKMASTTRHSNVRKTTGKFNPGKASLCNREDVPHRHREPYILSGYRPLDQPWTYYLKSLFFMHNETLNVWSHLLASFFTVWWVYVLYENLPSVDLRQSVNLDSTNVNMTSQCRRPSEYVSTVIANNRSEVMFPTRYSDVMAKGEDVMTHAKEAKALDDVMLRHVAFQAVISQACASICCFLASAVAHLFHSRSIPAQDFFLRLDFAGVGTSLFGNGIMVYFCSGNASFYAAFGSLFPALICLSALSIVISQGVGRSMYTLDNPVGRKLHLAPVVVLGIITGQFFSFRLYDGIVNGTWYLGDTIGYHGFNALVIQPLNGVFFSMHIPERFCPGKFDIWCHGHQWFHLLVVVASFTQMYACSRDVATMPIHILKMSEPTFIKIWGYFGMFLVLNILFSVLVCFCGKKYSKKIGCS